MSQKFLDSLIRNALIWGTAAILGSIAGRGLRDKIMPLELLTGNCMHGARTTQTAGAYLNIKPSPVEKLPQMAQDVEYKTTDFSGDSEKVALARMLFGEARQSDICDEERYAIAYSAVNRSKDGKRGNGEGSIKEVVLKPNQYSCFNDGDSNREKLMDPEAHDKKSWDKALRIAKGILEGKHSEFNLGQTNYFNPKSSSPKWKTLPEVSFSGYNFKHTFRRED